MTNTQRSRVILLGALCLSLVQPIFAQTSTATASALPRLVRFGGTAKDLNGGALTGVVGVTFALYAEQTGGAPLWQETQNVTADSSGHYSALLGSTKTEGLPADLFTSEQAHWVGVQVEGQPEQPRVLLVSTPYALKAVDAETVGGLPPSAFMLAPSGASAAAGSAVTAAPEAAGVHGMANGKATPATIGTDFVPIFTNTSGALGNSVMFQSGTNIGINTVTPSAALDVNGSIYMPATNSSATAGVLSIGVPFLQSCCAASAHDIFLGAQAGNFTNSGLNETAVGYQALNHISSGAWNTAIGTAALYYNTGGSYDTAVGIDSLYENTSGGNNTAVGTDSLYSSNGGNNTAAGYKALFLNTTGSNNTALGYEAGPTTTSLGGLTNSTAIGANATYTESNALVLGSINGVNGATSSVNVGIGTTAPAYTLDVQGTGNFAGPVNSGSGFELGGTLFDYGSYTNENAFLGFAGNTTNTAQYNTGIGWQALLSETSGNSNTAIGQAALEANTTGFGNTAVGVRTLQANNTGGYNTAAGRNSLFFNTTGSYNVAVGQTALYNNSTGSYNIGIGLQAGNNITTTNYNIDIANQGVAGDNGVIRIGTAGSQNSAYISGIFGVTTSLTNAVPVLIDGNGNLGTMSSSRRYKEDIQNMADASSGLMRLRPVTFRYKQAYADGAKPVQYGLIAEEVAEVYPDLVARTPDGRIETVKYQVLDPMLLNELQKQYHTIQSLEERLAKVEAALAGTAITTASH